MSGVFHLWNVLCECRRGSAPDGLGQVSPHATAGTVTVGTAPPTASIEALVPYYRNQQSISLNWRVLWLQPDQILEMSLSGDGKQLVFEEGQTAHTPNVFMGIDDVGQ